MSYRTKSAKIAWVIGYVVAGLVGGWLGNLIANIYWGWRLSEDPSTDPLEVAASIGFLTAAGAVLLMYGLWYCFDRPVRQAHRQEQLRLGPSRHQRRSHT